MVAKISKFSKKQKSVLENVAVVVVFFGIVFSVIGFFLYQNIHIGQKRAELEHQLAALQAEYGEVATQQGELEKGVANTQTAEYQEKILREQGLYKKEGEEVVTILPPEEISEEGGEQQRTERTWRKPWTW